VRRATWSVEILTKLEHQNIKIMNTIPGNIYYQHQNASLHSNATIETTHQTNTNMASLGRIESKPNTNNNRHPKINLAFADRLKPTCSQRSSMSSESSIHGIQATDSSDIGSSWRIRAERSRNNHHGSPTQHRAKAIIRKYRRHVRHVEFKRLRSIVPAVAGNEKASQAEILEETIRYIDDLHQQLLRRIHTSGVPATLRDSAQETPVTLSSRPDGVNGSSSSSSPGLLIERPTNEWTTNDVKNLVETALAPRLEAKLRQKRREDRERLDHILQASSLITDLHSSPSSLIPGRIE